jgi:hypothetical protein
VIIRRIVKEGESGALVGELALTKEQAAFLINMGLVTLVAAGTATVQDMSQEEFNEAIQKEQEAAETEEGEPSEDIQVKTSIH